MISNLIFFVPKREVNIEIEDITEQIKDELKHDIGALPSYVSSSQQHTSHLP